MVLDYMYIPEGTKKCKEEVHVLLQCTYIYSVDSANNNLLVPYKEWYSLIGYANHYLFCDR